MKRTFLLSILLASSFSYLRSQTAVVIDQYKTYQTMAGLGGHDPRDQTNLMMDDLGVTVMRI